MSGFLYAVFLHLVGMLLKQINKQTKKNLNQPTKLKWERMPSNLLLQAGLRRITFWIAYPNLLNLREDICNNFMPDFSCELKKTLGFFAGVREHEAQQPKGTKNIFFLAFPVLIIKQPMMSF